MRTIGYESGHKTLLLDPTEALVLDILLAHCDRTFREHADGVVASRGTAWGVDPPLEVRLANQIQRLRQQYRRPALMRAGAPGGQQAT